MSNRRQDQLVLASDPRALSDAAAFWLLVLALAGVIGAIVAAVLGFHHLLPLLQASVA